MYDVRDESLLKALNGRSLHEREIMASVQNGAMEAFRLEGSIVAAEIRASIAAERSALKRRTLDAMNKETLSRAALRGTREEQSIEFAHIFQSRAFAKVGEVPDSVDSIVDIPLDVMTLALWRRSLRFFLTSAAFMRRTGSRPAATVWTSVGTLTPPMACRGTRTRSRK
jgi:hypothetical protein